MHPARLLHLALRPLPTPPGALEQDGWRIETARAPEAARAVLELGGCDLLLAERELVLADWLTEVLALPDPPAVVLLDAFGSQREQVAALRAGVAACLGLPLSAEQLRLALERARLGRELARENARLRRRLGEGQALGPLWTCDARMQQVFEMVEAVAGARVNLLLQGESGTGKTQLARAIHQRSERAQGPFIELNCGALPASLLESELFGHARGAFTGAQSERIGRFEAAHGGTLFLDEIASSSADLQVKLLRVLESGRFERLGETSTRAADVRVIAASNRDLAQEVRLKSFREDLYYRIHVVCIDLPPLRERPGDIPLLAQRFLAHFRGVHGRGPQAFSPACIEALLCHPWPGNVRELQHTIERAVLLAQTPELGPDLLGTAFGAAPARTRAPQAAEEGPLLPLKQALEQPERAAIERALRAAGGHRERAAELLGINRATLFNKLRKYGLGRHA